MSREGDAASLRLSAIGPKSGTRTCPRAWRGPVAGDSPSWRIPLERATCLGERWSDGDDLDQWVKSAEVGSVARVQACTMSMGRGGDEKVHDAGSRLPAGLHHGRSQLAVAPGHCLIHRQGVEEPLDEGQAAQPLCSAEPVAGDEHAEMELSQRGRADGELPFEWRYRSCVDYARIQYRPHSAGHGSRTTASSRSRSAVHSGSGGPSNSPAISRNSRQV